MNRKNRKSIHDRKFGSVVVRSATTLVRGQDDAVIAAIEKCGNLGAFTADAYRSFVDRFKTVNPDDLFRVRKDGRLELTATLEFITERDAELIERIRTAPKESLSAVIIALMRSGGVKAAKTGAQKEREIDLSQLGEEI